MSRAPAFLAILCAMLAAWPLPAGEGAFPAASREHWAWQAPRRPSVPAVEDREWAANPIDAFILRRLEDAGLRGAPEGPRERLIRRVTLDLTGLPPDPRDVDEFLADRLPGAWERVVDRLLASPRYGERWARHWLDLARFAETNGYEHDEARPDAWRYRDYVVRSFNADKPYDRFIEEQLAGDEIHPGDPEALIATGFNLLGPDMTDAADQKARRHNSLADMTDTAGLAFLGLTIACARCHDHKFEPLLQSDYYRLLAFFTPASFRRDLPIASAEEREAHASAAAEHAALVRPFEEEAARIEAPSRARLHEEKLAKLSDEARGAHAKKEAERTPREKDLVEKTVKLLAISPAEVEKGLDAEAIARRKEILEKLKLFEKRKPKPLPAALGLSNGPGEAPPTHLLERGDFYSPANVVEPGFPRILSADPRPAGAAVEPGTGRRTALARWIACGENPLTARVIVNRLWQHHFGRGIVPTPSDFGTRGEPPTHAELLDWLSMDLVESGWSLKRLHRRMLLSSTYRQTSIASPEALAKDPENRLFSRANRLRLEGEAVRDAILASSGRLHLAMGGPGVFPPIPAAAVQGSSGWPSSPGSADGARRSLYIFARRNLRFPFLEAFDLPDSNLSCPRRDRSTTAPQALALLNSPEVLESSAALERRIEARADSTNDRIALAFRIVLGRSPEEAEMSAARAFLEGSALRELCRALYNLNEFVYLD